MLSVWSAPRNDRGVVFSMRGPCREDIGIWEWELTGPTFRSSKGTEVWPEVSVCDVTCAVVHRYWECVM
jgi:hypothetical protein